MSIWRKEDTDDLHLTQLTIDRFAAVTFELRRQAAEGDKTAGLVADAMESVLRRRIAAALVVQSLPEPTAQPRWWWRWERREGDTQQ